MVIVIIVSAVFLVPGDFPCTCLWLRVGRAVLSLLETMFLLSHYCVTIIDEINPRERGGCLGSQLKKSYIVYQGGGAW